MLSRGVDSILANTLINQGYNLGNLKSMSESRLYSLGLKKEFIESVLKESRPSSLQKQL